MDSDVEIIKPIDTFYAFCFFSSFESLVPTGLNVSQGKTIDYSPVKVL
jgi:hypothetical protein